MHIISTFLLDIAICLGTNNKDGMLLTNQSACGMMYGVSMTASYLEALFHAPSGEGMC